MIKRILGKSVEQYVRRDSKHDVNLAIHKIEAMFNNMSKVYKSETKEIIISLERRYAEDRGIRSEVIQVIENNGNNIKEILNQGIDNIARIQVMLNKQSSNSKGYNILDDDSTLYQNIRIILDRNISIEIKQTLIEKSITKYYEDLFTNLFKANDDNRLIKKVISQCYNIIDKNLSLHVIHKHKPIKYKKLVQKLREIDVKEFNNEGRLRK